MANTRRESKCLDEGVNAVDESTPTSTNYAVVAHDVCFSYDDAQVLYSVCLNVRRGEVVGLLGPNGTGKSTLMKVLCGDVKPSTGSVHIYGKPVDAYSRRELARTRGVMPQSSYFPFAYTSRDVVEMGRFPWSTNASENKRIVDESLVQADVKHLADREVTFLSGGEASRVTFGRVLAGQGSVIFLDEPTAALDIAHQEHTMRLCSTLASTGVSVVALMHDIQLAAAYCDRIALMSRGRIVAFGEPSEVLTEESLSEVYQWTIKVGYMPTGELVILPQRCKDADGKELLCQHNNADKSEENL